MFVVSIFRYINITADDVGTLLVFMLLGRNLREFRARNIKH